MTSNPIHLLDVSVAYALLDEAHVHHAAASAWFETPRLRWALCAFTEAGILRLLTRTKTLNLPMEQATGLLKSLMEQPGYHYQPITADWETLIRPFAKRLHGHNQVTDAYLLGLALREGLVVATFDKGMLHLAGEDGKHVLVLQGIVS